MEMTWGLSCSAIHMLRCLAQGQAEEQQAVVEELHNVEQLHTMSNLLFPVCGKGEEDIERLGDLCCSALPYIDPLGTSCRW